MQTLLTNPEWIKEETKSGVSYTVKDFNESFHYENHHIGIYKEKGSNYWLAKVCHGELGESVAEQKVYSGFKEAQNECIAMAIECMKQGSFLISP